MQSRSPGTLVGTSQLTRQNQSSASSRIAARTLSRDCATASAVCASRASCRRCRSFSSSASRRAPPPCTPPLLADPRPVLVLAARAPSSDATGTSVATGAALGAAAGAADGGGPPRSRLRLRVSGTVGGGTGDDDEPAPPALARLGGVGLFFLIL